MPMTVGALRARVDADIDGALRGISQVQRAMKSLTRVETVVRVRLDISQARSQLQPFLQQLRNIQRSSLTTTVNLNVKTNLSKAREDLLAFKKQANSLKSEIKPIEIRVKAGSSQKSLGPIIAQLRSLQKASAAINVQATVGGALQKLQKVLDLIRDIRKEASVTINLKIDGDSVRHLRDIHRHLAQLTGSGTNWSSHAKGIRAVGQSAREASPALSRLKEILLAFGAGYLGITGIQAALGALKSVFIDFNNVLAQAQTGFTTLFANGGLSIEAAEKKAAGLLESLKAFSIPTPFELVDLAPLAQQALAFGLVSKSAKDVGKDLTGLLQNVGDAAYGLGRGKEGVDRIILALGQMKVATRVMGQDMLQLQAVGINAWQYLSEATGKSTGELRKLVADGLIPADGAIKAIRAGLARDFGGGMERAAKTLAGAASQIRDTLKVKITDAFKPQYEELTRLAVSIAQVLNTKAFQQWADDAMGKVEVALAFVTGAFQGLVGELQSGNPVIIGILAGIGARFIWLQAVAVRAAIAGMASFAATTPGMMLIAAAAVAAFAQAYSKNMYGVRGVTNSVVSFINRQLAGLSKGLAYVVETVSGVLQKIPDSVLAATPGGLGTLALKKMLGDQSGLKQEVATYWDETLAAINSPDGLSVDTGIKFDLFGDFRKMLSDAKTEAASAAKSIKANVAKVKIPGITLGAGNDKDKAAKKAAAQALRVLKDQLGDSAQAWDAYASAVENAADRQIKALKGIQDSLVSVFDGLKQNLIQAGIVSDPLQPIISRLSGVLQLRGQAGAIASAAQSRIDFAHSAGNAARSAQERAGGLDGVVPMKGGGTFRGSGNAVDVARSMLGIRNSDPRILQQMGGNSGLAWCVGFIQAVRKSQGLKAIANGDLSVTGVRNWAKKQGLAYRGVPTIGDYATMKNVGNTASHIAIVSGVQGNRFTTIGGNEGSHGRGPRYSSVKDNNSYPINAGGVLFVRAGTAGLQATANATGRAQVAVRAMPGVPQIADRKDWGLNEFATGLSNIGKVPKGWGGAVGNKPGNEARFAIQTFLTTAEGRNLIAQLAPKIGGNSKNAPDQAAWFLRSQANAADTTTRAAMMPSRIAEAGRATMEFIRAKKQELNALRDSSKWLQTNAYDALGLARAQEETRARLEAENDERLKGLPTKQREWNITTRVKAAVGALVETYRHNAFAAHIQRISELDREYSGLTATTLEAQIAQRVFNQENAASLKDSEKQLQIARELRNERAKYAGEVLQSAKAATTGIYRSIEDLNIVNPVDALRAQFKRDDEDRSLIDPGWLPSLDLIRERARQIEATFKKWNVDSTRQAVESIKELMDDANLSFSQTYEKFAQMWRDYIDRKSAVMPDNEIGGAKENAAYLKAFERARANALGEPTDLTTYGNRMDELVVKSTSFLKSSRDAFKEFNESNLTIVDKAEAARDEIIKLIPVLRALAIAHAAPMDAFEQTVAQITADTNEAYIKTQNVFNNEQSARTNDDFLAYADKINDLKSGMNRENHLGSILSDTKRAVEEWKYSLRDQGIKDEDIEAILPAKRIQMRAEEARGYIQQFLSSTQSTLTSAFESIFTEGPGKFFSNLLSGLEQTLAQMSAQILSSFVTNWLTNLIGGAVGGGGNLFGGGTAGVGPFASGAKYAGALPGFAIGLPRVPFDNYAVRVHKDEAILSARDANAWRRQQREDARLPSRSANGNGSTPGGGGTTIVQQFHVGQIVANSPDEFRRKLPGRGTSRAEMERAVALSASRGQGRF